MRVHFINEEKNTELNLDFTKFFSTKCQTWKNGDKIEREALKHSQMVKDLIETYIGIIDVNRYEKNPVDIVDMLFKESLQELEEYKNSSIKDNPYQMLEKNYRDFREKYHLEEKADPVIKKMNGVRKMIGGNTVKKIKLGDCATLCNGYFLFVYDKSDGFEECIIESYGKKDWKDDDKEHWKEALLKLYEPVVDNSEYKLTTSYSNLKLLNDGLDSTMPYHLIEVGGLPYNLKDVIGYLSKKEPVKIWKNRDILLMRQSDRDIVLMRTSINNTHSDWYEINRLEEYAI